MPRTAKATPVITNAEILTLAINQINGRIASWREKCDGLPGEYFEKATDELFKKKDALKTMYYFETGTEFDG